MRSQAPQQSSDNNNNNDGERNFYELKGGIRLKRGQSRLLNAERLQAVIDEIRIKSKLKESCSIFDQAEKITKLTIPNETDLNYNPKCWEIYVEMLVTTSCSMKLNKHIQIYEYNDKMYHYTDNELCHELKIIYLSPNYDLKSFYIQCICQYSNGEQLNLWNNNHYNFEIKKFLQQTRSLHEKSKLNNPDGLTVKLPFISKNNKYLNIDNIKTINYNSNNEILNEIKENKCNEPNGNLNINNSNYINPFNVTQQQQLPKYSDPTPFLNKLPMNPQIVKDTNSTFIPENLTLSPWIQREERKKLGLDTYNFVLVKENETRQYLNAHTFNNMKALNLVSGALCNVNRNAQNTNKNVKKIQHYVNYINERQNRLTNATTKMLENQNGINQVISFFLSFLWYFHQIIQINNYRNHELLQFNSH